MTLIAAIDWGDAGWAAGLVERLCGVVEGFKVGLPFMLAHGASAARGLARLCPGALWVADLKLADIGYVMGLSASLVAGGFDAVIAHGFVGRRGALDELKARLDELGLQLVVVASMSHPGAREAYDAALPAILEAAAELGAWGVVAPATRPWVVAEARRRLPRAVIMSPGVGAQGARPGDALCAGADYEIVGRLITGSPDPRAAAESVKRAQLSRLSSCRPG